jgi:hypothetical protein
VCLDIGGADHLPLFSTSVLICRANSSGVPAMGSKPAAALIDH